MEMENGGFLFAAYSIIWAVLFGFVLYLLNKQKKLDKEIKSLKESLEEKEGKQ